MYWSSRKPDNKLFLFCVLIFRCCEIFFSVAWLIFFKTGPFEWVFRKVAS
ncbi:DUF418 domain-containing protein [Colwellia sp. C1TZA3]|nr:DUF418 domain-containing protein [Colwellia sp. C1TZA3]